MEIHVTENKEGFGILVIGENCLSLVERLSRKDLKKLSKMIKKVLDASIN